MDLFDEFSFTVSLSLILDLSRFEADGDLLDIVELFCLVNPWDVFALPWSVERCFAPFFSVDFTLHFATFLSVIFDFSFWLLKRSFDEVLNRDEPRDEDDSLLASNCFVLGEDLVELFDMGDSEERTDEDADDEDESTMSPFFGSIDINTNNTNESFSNKFITWLIASIYYNRIFRA